MNKSIAKGRWTFWFQDHLYPFKRTVEWRNDGLMAIDPFHLPQLSKGQCNISLWWLSISGWYLIGDQSWVVSNTYNSYQWSDIDQCPLGIECATDRFTYLAEYDTRNLFEVNLSFHITSFHLMSYNVMLIHIMRFIVYHFLFTFMTISIKSIAFNFESVCFILFHSISIHLMSSHLVST